MFFVYLSVIAWLFLPEQNLTTKVEKTQNRKGFYPLTFLQTFKSIQWTNLWDLFLVKFFMAFAVLIYRSNFSMWLDYKFEASTKVIGYLSSFSALIGTGTGFAVGHIASYYGNNNSKLLFHACCIQLIVILSLTFAPSLWFVAAVTVPLSVANSIARVASTNLTIERGKGQDTGTLLGFGASILSVARMMSPSMGGIAQEMHVSGPTIMGGIVAVIGVSVMMISKQFRVSLFKDNPGVANSKEK